MRSILAICRDLTDGEAQREKNEKEGKENLFLLRLYMGVGMVYTLHTPNWSQLLFPSRAISYTPGAE